MCPGRRKMPRRRSKSFSSDADRVSQGGKRPGERFQRRGSELAPQKHRVSVGALEVGEAMCTCQERTEESGSVLQYDVKHCRRCHNFPYGMWSDNRIASGMYQARGDELRQYCHHCQHKNICASLVRFVAALYHFITSNYLRIVQMLDHQVATIKTQARTHKLK